MPPRSPPGDDKKPGDAGRAQILKAALLRAQGVAWTAVAKEVGASLAQVKCWPARHPRLWRKATLVAEEQLLREATAESVLTLRKQLRSDDDKTSRDAAQRLIAFRIAWRNRRPAKPRCATPTGRPVTLARRVADYLERLTDADLDAMLVGPTGEGRAAPGDGPPGD